MSDSYASLAITTNALWAPAVAFAVSLLAVWWLATGRFSETILDYPQSRSLHEVPRPRTGGLGMHAGIVIALGMTTAIQPASLWIAYSIVLLISFFDDVRGIAPAWRLAVHVGACALFSHTLFESDGFLATLAATLFCTWMANLYNFMDGADGMAGGMATTGFSFYGIAALLAGHGEFAMINFSIAAAAMAFLLFNFYPARIFLGDAGSVPLGFLAAALGILGWLQHDWTWWFPFLVFGPFIADSSITLGRRLLRLEKIWQPHRDHYYQRLVRAGWGHRKTTLAAYALMLTSGMTAMVGLKISPTMQIVVLIAATIGYLILILLIEHAWRRHLTMNTNSADFS